MRSSLRGFLALALALSWAFAAEAQLVDGVRSIRLNEDRDQKWFVSKVYELKHIGCDDITPWVWGAVQRYSVASTCQSLNYAKGGKQWIVVTTGRDMMPYVDKMVATMDRPSAIKDAQSSIVDGSGIYRFVYHPKYRANDEMITTVLRDTRSDGYGWYESRNNIFYWKDSKSDGENLLQWLKAIDRPVPQSNVSVTIYEITENDFKELGFDWLAWKNGPGASFFGTGLDITSWKDSLASSGSGLNTISKGAMGATGGFMFAPQFDATFLRMLAEKGKAKASSSSSITLVNDYTENPGENNFAGAKYKISFSPQYQYISADADRTLSVLASSRTSIQLYFKKPTFCFGQAGEKANILVFGWEMLVSEATENANAVGDNVVYNQHRFLSYTTLATGAEKLMATYTKDHKVDQRSGIPYLCDIPVLKYIFGSVSESRVRSRCFVTVKAEPIVPASDMSPWAGKVVDAAQVAPVN